MQQKHNF